MLFPLQATQPTAPDQGVLRSVVDVIEDPVFLEVACLTIAALLFLWFVLGLRSSLGRLQGRRLLVKYLQGVEAGLSGDPETATEMLAKVVEADPENVGARIALGDALYRLERPAEAHQHHMEAHQVFAAEGPALHLALVRDLRAAGEVGEAIDRVDAALASHGKDNELLEEAWQLKNEAGQFRAALTAGRVLYERSGDPELRRRLATTAARAGMVALSHGEREAAERFFTESLGYDPENGESRTGRLLLSPQPDRALLPERTGSSGPPAASVMLERVLDFFPESVCPDCGAARAPGVRACPSCRSTRPACYAEAGLEAPIENAGDVFDEIEENDAWFRRLALRAQSGDPAASSELRDAGAAAVRPVLEVLLESGDRENRLHEALVASGRVHPGALLAARDAVKARDRGMLDRLQGRPNADQVLAPVFRRLGPEALPKFQELIQEGGRLANRGLRGLVVDYYLGLGDREAFEELAARYAPVEIVRKLNSVPAGELAPLFAQLPDGPSFLREAILLEPAFDHPAALVLAALAASDDAVDRWRSILEERAHDGRVIAELVANLGVEASAQRAERLLEDFPRTSPQHLVAAFADPDTDGTTQSAIARLLVRSGADAVPDLVRCFGSTPAEVDDRAILVLSSIGDSAVRPLTKAYREQVGWLGKFGGKLFRSKHPRSCIIRALARTGSAAARRGLEDLLDYETELDLSSLIKESMRQRDGGAE